MTPRPIEESPESFLERFSAHREEVFLFPEPWGSPLVEAKTPAGVVYAFDRGPPPTPTGPLRALLHGVAEAVGPLEGEAFLRREGPRYRLGGETTPLGGGFYLLEAGAKVVVYWEGPMPKRAEVLLSPPLMLFR
ncbi:hypothetical protein Theos_1277 [Thermus oshimai JL-2]|uniref:Uncharacterized protein n=1 Tax=Thermus oshimai JL-2 TaxID=751945 RepID=K7RIW3_THEOS|nr:hypothetical protein [Thermus oshimai]AFV76317.1 hypothetical protein Theos_1277 [Thermus oshimai JL-2]